MVTHSDEYFGNDSVEYIELAEGILGVLKSSQEPLTALEVAEELSADSAAVQYALWDEDLDIPVERASLDGRIRYSFKGFREC